MAAQTTRGEPPASHSHGKVYQPNNWQPAPAMTPQAAVAAVRRS